MRTWQITRREVWKRVVEKDFEFDFWTYNRLPDVCNQLPTTELMKFKFKSHDPSKYNCVIDYQWRNSEKAFWKDTSLQTILKRNEGPIYMCVWLKKKREIFQENFIAKCSLNNSWENTCKSIKSSSMNFNCNILLLKREFFFFFLFKEID